MSFRRLSVAGLAVCSAVLLGLLLVGIRRARLHARMMSSSNNLRQMGLAAQNYQDTYRHLPPGTTGNSMAEAQHGHLIRLLPFMEATSIYSLVDFDFPWDHGLNRHLFRSVIPSYQRPSADRRFTTEGFALTHYMANPRLIHRQSDVSMDRLKRPADDVWLFGEVAGGYVPWGYPFGWRQLSWPIGGDSNSYGGWPQGAQFVTAGGAVRLVSTTVDRQLVEQMTNAGPEVPAPLIEVPQHEFQTVRHPSREPTYYPSPSESQMLSKWPGGTTVYFDAAGNAEVIRIIASRNDPHLIGLDINVTVDRYPQARMLVLDGLPLTDPVAASINRLRELEVLVVDSWALTAEGTEVLANLPRLELLSIPRNAVADDVLHRFAHLALRWQ